MTCRDFAELQVRLEICLDLLFSYFSVKPNLQEIATEGEAFAQTVPGKPLLDSLPEATSLWLNQLRGFGKRTMNVNCNILSLLSHFAIGGDACFAFGTPYCWRLVLHRGRLVEAHRFWKEL